MPSPGWLIAVLVAYLCGSTPFGLLIGKAKGVDLRKAGSGNIGATNCGRVLGKKWGIVCFLLDLLKGFGPVFGSGLYLGYVVSKVPITTAQQWDWLMVAIAAVLGHVFPIWLVFKGGKGVATGLGAVLGVWPGLTLPALAAAAVWAAILGLTRYVGLSSVVASISLPLFVWFFARRNATPVGEVAPYLWVTSAMALLIIFRHRGNLRRTFAGTEPRIGRSRPTPPESNPKKNIA